MAKQAINSDAWYPTIGHSDAKISIFCAHVEAVVVLQELTVIAKSFGQKVCDYCRKKRKQLI